MKNDLEAVRKTNAMAMENRNEDLAKVSVIVSLCSNTINDAPLQNNITLTYLAPLLVSPEYFTKARAWLKNVMKLISCSRWRNK